MKINKRDVLKKCLSIVLSITLLSPMLAGFAPIRAFANTESPEFNGFQLVDTQNDSQDTLEHVYVDDAHKIALKKTEYGSSTASAISKVFSNGVSGNAKYKISFDIKGEGDAPRYMLHVLFWNAEGTDLVGSLYNAITDTGIDPSEGWKSASAEVIAPENAAKIELRIQSYSATSKDGDAILLDNVVVAKYVMNEASQPDDKPEKELLPLATGHPGEGQWYVDHKDASNVAEIVDVDDTQHGALHVKQNSNAATEIRYELPTSVETGAYTVSLKIKGTVVNDFWSLILYAPYGGTDFRPLTLDTSKTTYSDWTELTGTVQFTTNPTGKLLFGIWFDGPIGNGTELYIDDLKISDAEGKDALEGKGSFDKKVDASTIPVEEWILEIQDCLNGEGSFDNLTYYGDLNGSFEEIDPETGYPKNWIYGAGNMDVEVTDQVVQDGNHALKFTTTEETGVWSSPSFTSRFDYELKPNTYYSLSFYVKNENYMNGGVGYASLIKNGDMTGNSGRPVWIEKEDLAKFEIVDGFGTEWKKVDALFKTDADTTHAKVKIMFSSWLTDPDAGQTLYIDNLQINEVEFGDSTELGDKGYEYDPEFEWSYGNETMYWVLSPGSNGVDVTVADSEASNAPAHSGRYAIKFEANALAENNDWSYGLIESKNLVKVKPNTTYEISYWVKDDGFVTGAVGFASLIKNGGTAASGAPDWVGKEDLAKFDLTRGFGNDWKQVKTTFKTDATTETVRVRFLLSTWGQYAQVGQALYLDDVEIREAVVDDNLNLGFESGTHNWVATTDATLDIDTQIFHGGTQSLHITKNDNFETRITSQARIDATLGQTLLFGGYVRSRNNINTKMRINLICYDKNGSAVKSDTSIRTMYGRALPLNADDQTSEWQKVMIAVPVPDDTVTVGFEIVILEGRAEVWVDDLFYRICNLSSEETLVDFSDLSQVDNTGKVEGWSLETKKGTASFNVKGTVPNTYAQLEVQKNSEAYLVYDTDYLLSGDSFDLQFKDYTATEDMEVIVKYFDYKGNHIKGADVTGKLNASDDKANYTMAVTVPSSTSAKIYFGSAKAGAYTLGKLDIIEVYKPDAAQAWLGQWIWYPEDTLIEAQYATRYFRHEFELDALPTYAPLQLSADDNYRVYVNGVEVGSNMNTGQDQWQAPVTYDILRYLKKGKNVLAIEAHNLVSYGGLVYDARVTMENENVVHVVSNGADVKVSRAGATNWTSVDFDASSWIAPKVIGIMGSSPWGSLYFNSALYAENKVEITSFDSSKSIKADSASKIKATITIEEPLKGDYPFEVKIYRKNSTKQITSAVLKIVEGAQPSQWKVGKNEVTFELFIPDYLVGGNYTLQLSDTYYYLTNEDVIDRQFASISVVGTKEKAELPKAEVKTYNGKPTVFINGEAKSSLFYLSPAGDLWWDLEQETKYAQTAETEIYVTNCTYLNKNGNKTEPIWVDEDTIDYDTFDRYIYEALSAKPDMMLVVAIGMQAPSWWLDQHPDDEIVIYNATTKQYENPATRAVSFSSEAYRKDAGEVLRKLVEHMKNASYASHIAGIKIQDGETQEYMTEGVADWTIGDFSKASLDGFRSYLRETYKTNAALQKAYNDSNVTFDNITIPTWDDRAGVWLQSGGKNTTPILDPETNRWTIDYQYYMGKVTSDTFLHYAEIIKEASDDKMMVGAYHGYVWNFATSGVGSTHPAIDEVLQSDAVDFICSPFVYGERDKGENAAYDAMLDGVQAAGKLYILELDTRSVYEVATGNADWDADIGYCYTMKECIQSLKRDLGGLIAKGAGVWIFNMYGSWWYDDQMLEFISDIKTEMYFNTYLDDKSLSDIALFVDEMIYPYTTPTHVYDAYQTYYFLFNQQRRNLATIGAGYDTYNMSDLVNGNIAKEYKINVMLSPYEITAEEKTAIEKKLMKDDKVIVWIYLPGLSDGKANSLDNIKDLTGFTVNYLNQRGLLTGVMLGGHALTEGIEGFTYGNDLNSALDSAGPLPYIDLSGEQNAIELAEFGANGKYTAMAMKDMGDWTSIYSTTMNLPSTFWRNLIKEADGHIWSDNESDIIHASEHYLSVYSLFGGERTITLPKSGYSVYDVYEEKYIPVTGNTFKFTMEDNSGRLFRLMSANKVAVLARTNGAHATLDKLGVTEVTPGADYTVSIKVDQGYYLSAVTVNGKQVDVQKTIKLKDVVNSTEIVFEVKQVKTYENEEADDYQDTTVDQTVQPSDSGEESETPETPIEEETKMPSKEENNKVTQMPSIFVTTTTIKWGKIILLFVGILSGVAIVATMIEVLAVYFRRKKNSRRK